MKRHLAVIGAILMICPPALAQQAPQQAQPPGMEAVSLAYRQMGLGLNQMAAEHQAAVETLRQRIAAMDAYLKACKDGHGCTVPVPDKK